jgi:hypothetical protein
VGGAELEPAGGEAEGEEEKDAEEEAPFREGQDGYAVGRAVPKWKETGHGGSVARAGGNVERQKRGRGEKGGFFKREAGRMGLQGGTRRRRWGGGVGWARQKIREKSMIYCVLKSGRERRRGGEGRYGKRGAWEGKEGRGGGVRGMNG